MLDHISFGVADPWASKAFYDAALKPLGMAETDRVGGETPGGRAHFGYGYAPGVFAFDDPRAARGGKNSFWIGGPSPQTARVHLAFIARTHAEVDAFHAAALKAGGRDNGAPGERSDYHKGYYAAFVLDPDGNNVEAVCRSAMA